MPQKAIFTAELVDGKNVRRVVSHRVVLGHYQNEEQYLLEWKKKSPSLPSVYSWHSIAQLERCLGKVQKYLDELRQKRSTRSRQQHALPNQPSAVQVASASRKRKSPDSADDVVFSDDSTAFKSGTSTPLQSLRVKDSSAALSIISISSEDGDGTSAPENATDSRVPDDQMVFNGYIVYSDGLITVKLLPNLDHPVKLPTAAMDANAMHIHNTTGMAEYAIQMAFRRSLAFIPGPPVTLDAAETQTPALKFAFISQNILGRGVEAPDPDIVVGCGNHKEGTISCRPNMGGNIGCEYSRVCECLEDAPVDEARLTPEQHKLMASGELMGLPKRFPYSNPNGANANCLTPFYLAKRSTIYECNDKCACGPGCKTRVVQHGRNIPLQIFRTASRGWGLRSPAPLRRGQFIDTYRGEIITVAEADERQKGAAGKPCYLYDLDKHVLEDDGTTTRNDYYVVDGEHVGGPTRFMNHSCAPNCLQYCVSLNKHDTKIFELAFFALRDIPANEELTFDYLDKDVEDDEEDPGEMPEDATPCLCGSENCRKWLWT